MIETVKKIIFFYHFCVHHTYKILATQVKHVFNQKICLIYLFFLFNFIFLRGTYLVLLKKKKNLVRNIFNLGKINLHFREDYRYVGTRYAYRSIPFLSQITGELTAESRAMNVVSRYSKTGIHYTKRYSAASLKRKIVALAFLSRKLYDVWEKKTIGSVLTMVDLITSYYYYKLLKINL